MSILERPGRRPPGLAEFAAAFSSHSLANGLVAFLFAATGPLAIVLTVATGGGLDAATISTWLFGMFGVGGLLSLVYSTAYRMPLAHAWTIPGTVLLVPALDHLSFAECVGAFWASGVVIVLLGMSGLVGRTMAAIPLTIVMGMVAGVFLPLGLGVVDSVGADWRIAVPMVLAWLGVAAFPRLARVLPPVLAALVAGVVALWWTGTDGLAGSVALRLVDPAPVTPVFSWQAMAELVIPLTITVVVIQNAQGFFVLRAAGYRPPENALTVGCGVGTLMMAGLNSVPACVAGPGNAMLNASGAAADRWAGGIVFGLLMILFGLFSPVAADLGLALPPAFIVMLGGLAMLPVLQQAFLAAFKGQCPTGALVCFLVTVAGDSLLNVGAAFWGLVAGCLVSLVLERDAFLRRA